MDATAARRELKCKVLAAAGIRVEDNSADEWMRLALDAEEQRIDCGPFDPAAEWLSKRQRHYEDAAALRELMD